jgi:hypothetical protein
MWGVSLMRSTHAPWGRETLNATRNWSRYAFGEGKVLSTSRMSRKPGDHRRMNHHSRTVLGTRNSVLSRHGALTSANRETSDHRLKVVVRIDADLKTARIEVRGIVTPANLRALYVVARRTSALLPGKEIIIDLARARVADPAIEQLRRSARLSRLASGVDGSEVPCRLSIVDPTGAHRVKEPA